MAFLVRNLGTTRSVRTGVGRLGNGGFADVPGTMAAAWLVARCDDEGWKKDGGNF